jgi:hypothetical protein
MDICWATANHQPCFKANKRADSMEMACVEDLRSVHTSSSVQQPDASPAVDVADVDLNVPASPSASSELAGSEQSLHLRKLAHSNDVHEQISSSTVLL